MALKPLVVRMTIAVFAASVCTFAAGCLTGGSSGFPWLFPNGPAVQTHSKPPGPGYFADFDPQACRIEVRPEVCTAPLRGAQVFIATVYDGVGNARRNRRVEWMVEGPGSIIEVDESGYLHDRGMKVDNKFAYSLTNYLEHQLNRGGEDFAIGPGQTWCVVTSAVEGETTVTAYAPAIADWNKNRAYVRVSWTQGQVHFPPPITAKAGGESSLGTRVSKDTEAVYRIRYRIIDGPPAALTSSGGAESDDVMEAIASPGADGTARINISQPAPVAGTNRIAIEVIKASRDRPGDFTVVSKGQTKVTWKSTDAGARIEKGDARLEVRLDGPANGVIGESLAFKVTVTNAGESTVNRVRVQGRLGEGLELTGKGRLEETIAALEPGQSKSISLPVAARRAGKLSIQAGATASDLVAEPQTAAVEIQDAQLSLTAHGPNKAYVGQEVTWQLVVRNPTETALGKVVVKANLPEAVSFVRATDGGRVVNRQVVWELGDGPAKQERTISVTGICSNLSPRATLSANVTATPMAERDGIIRPVSLIKPIGPARPAESTIEIAGIPAIQLSVKDTADPISVGQRTSYVIKVKNAGTIAAKRVEVVAQIPALLSVIRASGAEIKGETVTFAPIESLAPNAESTFTVEVEARSAGEARFRAEARGAAMNQPVRAEEPTRILGRDARPAGQ